MTIGHAWVLLFLILPLGWLALEWKRTPSRIGLLLKVLCFCAVILALSEPRLVVPETKVAAAILVDTSASISESDLARATKFASSVEGARGRHWSKVIPFARQSRPLGIG